MITVAFLTTHTTDNSHVEFDGDNITISMTRKKWFTLDQPATITVDITVKPH